ncbi:MAG: hypothetical protein AAFU55_07815 [Pseudomonadota bacterium]
MRRAFHALALLLASATGAGACQPTPVDAAAEALLRSQAVFVGRATSMTEIASPDALAAQLRAVGVRPVEVTLEVEEVWKGEAPTDAISFNHLPCDGPFIVGLPYLFVHTERANVDVDLTLSDEVIAGRPVILLRDWMAVNDPSYLAEMRVYLGRLERGAPYEAATNNLSVVRKRFGLRP